MELLLWSKDASDGLDALQAGIVKFLILANTI